MARRKKRHFSHSQFSMYRGCPEKYRRHYIEGEKRPPGTNMVIGSAVHSVIEGDMKNVLKKGILLDDKKIPSVAEKTFKEKWAEGVALHKAQREAGEKATKAECLHMAVRQAKLFHEKVAPFLRPERIEHRWEIDLLDTDWILMGYIDLQEKVRKGEKSGKIHDFKVVAKEDKKAADNSDQLSMYALWAYKHDGAIPKLALNQLIKTKVAKAVTHETKRTKEQMQAMMENVMAVLECIEAGSFYGCERSNWLCDERYCSFWNDCKYTRGWTQI